MTGPVENTDQEKAVLWSGLFRRPNTIRRLFRHRGAAIGLTFLVALALVSIMAPAITDYDPIRMNPPKALTPPGQDHPFGTDQYGRDIYSRVLYGGRLSLQAGFLASHLRCGRFRPSGRCSSGLRGTPSHL